jgi:hypothetical protein
MLSRADVGLVAEWSLRIVLVGALSVALWRSLRTDEHSSTSRSTTTTGLVRELSAAVANSAIASLDLTLDAMPSHAQRDVLIASRRAGISVHWHGAPPALAIEATSVREPDGHARLFVTGGAGAPLALADSAGILDSVPASAGVTIDAASVVGGIRAQQGRFAATTFVAASAPRRAVLVLGRADWETKFVMSALTESGWAVRARIPTAPGVAVHDDAVLPIDTGRYDVVIALDSSAADVAPAIARFVADGGGLVAEAGALSMEPLRALAPARATDRQPGRILLADDSVTPRDLPVRPLTGLSTDALPLEHERAGVTLAARRAGFGRVLVVGYDESWRWRMLGGESGLAAHRRWWSAAVGSVAPEREGATESAGNAAPLAALIDALGEASVSAPTNSPSQRHPLPFVLLVLLAAALLAETASRRFRGAR